MEFEMDDRLKEMISAPLLETAALLAALSDQGGGSIFRAACLIAGSMRSGGKLMLCGNGGSAADCQHMAAEFVCRLSGDRDRPGLPALALTTDTSFLTAYCNDYCFEDVFSRQVLALGRKGDVLMGISTSGSSENIIRAIREADNIGMGTISLSRKGGRSGQYADVAIEVDSTKTAVIQNVHMAVEHVLCYIVEELIFGENSTADKG
ncbi:MAG TPA: SIS domain-containing protein [Synergistales bacterium]|nr:SIS domain-containing protein [Candidatus Cloacimonadota bacterium]HOI82554.1 SIS domain-containing protein [Synergistales bacterium]